MSLTAGTTLQNGKYLINQILGQGVLSVTFQGMQVQSNQPVVLKTLKQHSQAKVAFTQLKQRFAEQVSRFAQCQHPGLVRLVDFFEEADLPFAVMDYTVGQTLLEVVQTSGPLSEELAVRYVKQVGSALDEVHQHGLIHRDVTPKNIVCLPGSDSVVLVNFGIIHPAVLGWSDGFAHPPAGDYAAIEQYQPQLSPTPATDVYSLAGTLYFLLTAHAPVAAPLHHRSPLSIPRQFCPDLNLAIESAILKGLELNPRSRPQTVATWLSLLASEALLPVNLGNPAGHALPPTSANGNSQSSSSQSGSSLNGKAVSSPTYPSSSKVKKSVVVQATRKQPVSASSLKHPFFRTLITASAIAASLGLGTGLLFRLAAGSTGPGSSFFHSEQAFPPVKDWSGTATPATVSPDPFQLPEATKIKREPARTVTEPAPVAIPRPSQTVRPESQPSPQLPAAEVAPSPEPSSPTTSISPTPTPSIVTPEPATQNPEFTPPASAPTSEPPSNLSAPKQDAGGMQ